MASVAVVVIDEQGRLLLVRGDDRGWHAPGGVVETGETLEQAAVRECVEESGVRPDLELAGATQVMAPSVVAFVFRGTAHGQTAQPSPPETTDAGFFPLPAAIDMIGWDLSRQEVTRALRGEAAPFLLTIASF